MKTMLLIMSLVLITGAVRADVISSKRFAKSCTQLAIYAFDTKEDAWILQKSIKGNSPRINQKRNPKLFGDRKPTKHGFGYYRYYFEIPLLAKDGRIREYITQSGAIVNGRIQLSVSYLKATLEKEDVLKLNIKKGASVVWVDVADYVITPKPVPKK